MASGDILLYRCSLAEHTRCIPEATDFSNSVMLMFGIVTTTACVLQCSISIEYFLYKEL